MKQYPSAQAFDGATATVVTIGTFDGVHVGHRKIITRLVEEAADAGMASVVLTFFPHPRMVLQKDISIKLINTISERVQLLEEAGLDHMVIHPFTKEFSRMTAEDFVKEILVDCLKAKKVIIGYDHHFGRNRNANIDDLRKFGERYGFSVEEISKKDIDDVAISSTKIRRALESGNLKKANKYLGHPFMLTGTVTRGKGLGRTLNFPTANLHISESYKLIPAKGVYIVSSVLNEKLVYGMMSIGTNPTVGGEKLSIETYFLDFQEDLYDQFLCINMLARIRDEKHFEGVDALVLAMKQDELFSRNFIKNHGQ